MDKLATVSIQLISPMRGDVATKTEDVAVKVGTVVGFHSTDFPYERGLTYQQDRRTHRLSFHSTDFPYERGHKAYELMVCFALFVSIQLISPMRGDVYALRS